jgi:hypothetical protein
MLRACGTGQHMRRKWHRSRGRPGYLVAGAALAMLADLVPTSAERFENQVAVFAALDKVTANISKLEIPINETKAFGSLKVTPRVCYARPPDEQPKTTTFVEVDDTQLDGQKKRIFTGWMFAESPGLNAVEHPVFDVWLTGCVQPIAQRAAAGHRGQTERGAPDDEPVTTRRRVRR